MRPSQINALERILLEAPQGVEDQLVWFYRDLVELRLSERSPGESLCFRSARVELRIALKAAPRLDPAHRRAVISVRSLAQTVETLTERRIAFSRLSGLTWTDRRLSLVDPGGNRVELKQEWRAGVLPGQGREGASEPVLARSGPGAGKIQKKP
ncbi:MAG: VOC family protein [Planctomycetota bacterium]|jgi:catechol 2,3-dioxygenase-like lactoylglutathione lyase family enzyme